MREPLPFAQQAAILSRYLVGQPATNVEIALYRKAIAREAASDRADDQAVLAFAFRHPRFLPVLDAGLALTRPNAELRRRLYCMFSILEAMPGHSDQFLAPKRNKLQLLGLVLYGSRAVVRAATGLIVLKCIGAGKA